MANNIKKLLPTDIISDSMDKINSNFDILSSYSVFSDKSLTEYYKKIDDLVNQISGKVDLSESRLNIEFEKIRGEIKEYNDDVSSINQTAEMIQSTVSSLNKKFDGTVDIIQSQFTQTKDNISSVVEKYRDDSKADYNAIQKVLDGFQDQIDGNIETWYYDGEPTLNNEPVMTWIKDASNEEEKNKIYEKHQGDLYYDRITGFAYRFFKDGDVYGWKLIRDHEISEMLGKINQKSKIFTSTPESPYNVGDMWIDTDKDLFVCIKKRDSGLWSRDDWNYATRYKADLDDFKNKYQTDKNDFQNQIDRKIQYWFQDDDPAFDWTTDDEREKHINDLWYNTKQGITKVYVKTDSGYEWRETTDRNLEDLAQSAKDGNITIFYGEYGEGNDDEGNPRVKPSGYKRGDLWYNCTYPTGTKLMDKNNKYYHDTLRCQVEQDDSSFAIEHWVPINGGDMAFSRISQNVNDINLEVYGSSEDGKDSLRTLINQRATVEELEEAKTSITNKIDTEKSTILAKFDSYATNDKVDGVQSAVNELNTQINEGDSSIVSKLSQTVTKDKEHDTAISSLQSSVKQNGEDIASAKLDISANKNNITGLISSIAEIKTTADNAASKLELKSVSDKTIANETSIADLTTEIKGADGKSGLKAGFENAVSRIGANETSISGLTAKIGDDDSGIISRINAQATDLEGIKTAQATMQSSIDGHTASIKTMVTKDEMNSAISNITLDADRININADHKLSILTNGAFELSSDNCSIDATGKLWARNAEISGDITTSQLIATSASGNRKTTINANSFEITSTGDTTSSLSITIIDDMSTVEGYDSAPDELKSAKNVPTLCMEYGEKKYYLWPGAWKSISSGNTTTWESFEFFKHNTYKSLGDYRLVSYLSELTKVLNSHFNSSDNDGSSFLEEIATYFIFSDAVALTRGSNLEQSGGSKLYFMTDLLTGVDENGEIYSGQTDQATHNYLPILHKNDGYEPEYPDEKWEKVKDFYADIKDGAYVKSGEKCNTIMVSELYDYATTSGYDLEKINKALGINTIVNGYMLEPHGVSYSSLCLKNNSTSLNYSHAGSSFGINLYETVCYDIAATGMTDDEKKIKNFVGNVSSKTEVSGSPYGGGEMTVLCYPLYDISYGTIQSIVKKCLYVIVATGTGSMSGEDEGWQGGGEMSGQYEYGKRTFHLTYLIDNEPYYDDSGNYISLSTTVSNNKKKILAKLIDKLGTVNTGISKSSIEFVVRISTRENGQTFNNYTLFDGDWK